MNRMNDPEISKIYTDRSVRKEICRSSHYWFFTVYLSQSGHMKYKTALFQKEIFEITENDAVRNSVIVAFRGSAKSTIISLSYPIWAMIGRPEKKFIVILSQTQSLSRQILGNIKKELETNDLLVNDFGPFSEDDAEWRAGVLVIPKFNTRIMALSVGEGIRGLKHGAIRPDLIICDDVEDLQTVKTREGRDKVYQWLMGDVIPAGDVDTKLVVIGNLLHEDSLMMRLCENIEEGSMNGVYRQYPLLDEDDNPLWSDKFKTPEDIQVLRQKTPDEASFSREYLLTIISDSERVVHPEWIHYYDELSETKSIALSVTGIDLAISEKSSADYTAMVSAHVVGHYQERIIYILPNPINEKMSFPKTITMAKEVSQAVGNGMKTKIYVESVGYQKSLAQQLVEEGYPAEEVPVHGSDKRERLSLTTYLIKSGRVLFPRKGAEKLIEQIVGFGVEKHDDLADAFSLLVNTVTIDPPRRPARVFSKKPHGW